MEPKLKCPDCGVVLDFTAIRKCGSCGKILCGVCRYEFRKRSYCKPCHHAVARQASMDGMKEKGDSRC